MSTTLQTASLDLLKSCFLSDSITKSFYSELILNSDRSLCKKTLIGRIRDYCASDNISILNFLLNDYYTKFVKDAHKKKNCYILGTDGLVDSVHNLINVNYDVHKRDLITLYLLNNTFISVPVSFTIY